MADEKVSVGQVTVKVNAYRVIQECVERGLEYGWNRAHKHTEAPGQVAIQTAQEDAIMNELCEYLSFDSDVEQTDKESMDGIRYLLSGTEWSPNTLDDIARIVQKTGRSIDGPKRDDDD